MPKSVGCLQFGYTLIELLVVISIIGLLSVTAVAYSRSLSRDQLLKKALDNTQSLIRTAQSNATSAFNCSNTGLPGEWIVAFSEDQTTVSLSCVNSVTEDNPVPWATIKTLSLENVRVNSITGSSCTSEPLFVSPINVIYSPLTGNVTFSGAEDCITDSLSLTVTLKNINSDNSRSFKITKGGAIDVQ